MSKINRYANAGRAMITKFYKEAMEATNSVEPAMKEKMFLAQMDHLIGDISKPNKKKNPETLLFFMGIKNLIMDQAKIVYHNPACFDLPEVNEMGPSFTVASENGAYSETEPAEDASDAEDAADHGASSDAEPLVEDPVENDAEAAQDAAETEFYSDADSVVEEAPEDEAPEDEAPEDDLPSPKRLKPTNE